MTGGWEYRTGHLLTIPTGRADWLYYTEKNNWTYPAFHHLNIGATRTRYKNDCKKTELSFGLFNAYAHNNPWYVELGQDLAISEDDMGNRKRIIGSRLKLNGVSLFNVLPYISYKIILD